MSSSNHDSIPALDGFRAIACLLVVFVHFIHYILPTSIFYYKNLFIGGADNILFGAIGVAVFFVLSGFLMAHLYATQKITLLNAGIYLISRFSRIVPAYWLTILFCFLIYRELDTSFIFHIDEHNLFRHLIFLGSEGVFWSIPPEIQYYLFFILLWASWQQWCVGRRVPLLVVLLICGGFILSRSSWPGILLPSKLHFFLAGSIAAWLFHVLLVHHQFSSKAISMAQVLSLIGLCVGIAGLKGLNESGFYEHSLFFLWVAQTLMVFGFRSSLADYLFGNRLLRWLGSVSFSVYLLHCPVIYLVNRIFESLGVQNLLSDGITFLLAVLLPGCFSHWIELPLCRRSKKWAQMKMESWLRV